MKTDKAGPRHRRHAKLRTDPANLDPSSTPVLKGGMPKALGIRVTSLTPKKVVGEMKITPMHMNVNGRVNGGAWSTATAHPA